eukprot:g6760.t1
MSAIDLVSQSGVGFAYMGWEPRGLGAHPRFPGRLTLLAESLGISFARTVGPDGVRPTDAQTGSPAAQTPPLRGFLCVAQQHNASHADNQAGGGKDRRPLAGHPHYVELVEEMTRKDFLDPTLGNLSDLEKEHAEKEEALFKNILKSDGRRAKERIHEYLFRMNKSPEH